MDVTGGWPLGCRPITTFDASDYATRIAAEVKGFDPSALFGRRDARRMDRFTQFAVAAAGQALQDAGLSVTESNLCAGQEPCRALVEPLRARGAKVHLIGGAEVATELDARRAIEQGTRVAASL